MTTTLAYRTQHKAFISADSQATYGSFKMDTAVKIFEKHGMVFAFSGNLSYIQMVMRLLENCLQKDATRPEDWVDQLRDGLMNDRKVELADKNNDFNMDIFFASSAGLFHLDGWMAITELEVGVAMGSGSGGKYAMGAMHALENYDLAADVMMNEAMKVAAHLDVYTGGVIFREEIAIKP